MDEVVCAHNFFKRKGAKPILQATVYVQNYGIRAKGWHVSRLTVTIVSTLQAYYRRVPKEALDQILDLWD